MVNMNTDKNKKIYDNIQNQNRYNVLFECLSNREEDYDGIIEIYRENRFQEQIGSILIEFSKWLRVVLKNEDNIEEILTLISKIINNNDVMEHLEVNKKSDYKIMVDFVKYLSDKLAKEEKLLYSMRDVYLVTDEETQTSKLISSCKVILDRFVYDIIEIFLNEDNRVLAKKINSTK